MYEEFREKERKGWDAKADVYKDRTALIATQAIPTLLRAVRVRANSSFLDVCTGPGYAAAAASALCASATGVDFASEMVQVASRNFPDCTFLEGDALDLEFSDDTFDSVVCPFGILHVTDPRKLVSEAYRVVKAGGRYAFSQWCAPAESDFFRLVMGPLAKHADMSLVDPAPNIFEYSDRKLCRELMAEVGFSEIDIQEVPSVYFAPPGDFFANAMHMMVRGPIVVDAQTDAVKELIRNEINQSVLEFKHDHGIVVSIPSFVVSGKK